MVDVSRLITILAGGAVEAAGVALVAVSFLLIYKATGAVNFAQGDLVTLGAYLGYWTITELGLPLPVAWAVTLTLMFVIGLVLERVAYAPIRERSIYVVVISTLGMALVIRAGLGLWFGNQPKNVASPAGFGVVEVAGARIPRHDLLLVAVAAAAIAAVIAVFTRTAVGRRVRALATDRMAARLQGVRVARTSMVAFGASAALSGLAGLLLAPRVALTLNLGFAPMLTAFFAAILGGFGRLGGVVAGALVLAMAEHLGAGYLSPAYAEVYPFLLMLAVIAVRPGGLFGSELRARL